MAEETNKLLNDILKTLTALVEFEKTRFPTPIGPRPELDVWNLGKFIMNKTLPPGEWTEVWKIGEPHTPAMIYWLVVVTDTPKIKCNCVHNGTPVCGDGCDVQTLYDRGLTSYNNRVWVHLYDTGNSKYGLQCNLLRPIKTECLYKIQNYDSVAHTLLLCYPKWYSWKPP